MDDSLRKLIKFVLVIISGVLALVAGLFITTTLVLTWSSAKDYLTWKDKTTPLPHEVVEDLCQKFELTETDERCQEGATIYAPEFFDVIKDAFTPLQDRVPGYDDVESKLSEYKYNQEPVTIVSDGQGISGVCMISMGIAFSQ